MSPSRRPFVRTRREIAEFSSRVSISTGDYKHWGDGLAKGNGTLAPNGCSLWAGRLLLTSRTAAMRAKEGFLFKGIGGKSPRIPQLASHV
jgi:hypothetical protein